MDSRRSAASQRLRITIISIFLISTGIIALLLFGCIRSYGQLEEEKLAVVSEQLTFEKFEARQGRGGRYYLLYFKEYPEPLRIFSVTGKALHRETLGSLAENDVLRVDFARESGDICQISCNGEMILSLSDYARVNQQNQIVGMLCCFCAFLCVSFLAWLFLRAIAPLPDNGGLGKLRMEYTAKGNVIRIYHSGHVCSLVINGQVFDQHSGVYGSNFCLKGTIGRMNTGGMPIRIEAKMGIFFLRLSCNGQIVAKKFMVFG